MSRFEVIDGSHLGGPEFFVMDSRYKVAHYRGPDPETARLIRSTLASLWPTFYAATYEGDLFVDVRCGGYAGAKVVSCIARAEDQAYALSDAVRTLEVDMHKAVALHVASGR